MARVLVVDDERDVVELVKFLLERDGHQVIEAYNGREALEKAFAEKPDMIILDIMMPEMDGYTVNARLTENEGTRKIPVIILTAKGQMRDVFEMASNVAFYMEKPFDPKHLREKIQEVLNKAASK
jgi:two-component system alkaline phosphatase synthesis response regulator PhoP